MMAALYALVGVVVGIVIDEVVRRGAREVTGEPMASPGTCAGLPVQKSCGFVAQDYYDR
jgi:hypothetical protein